MAKNSKDELLREVAEWIKPLVEEPVNWVDEENGIAATQVTYRYHDLAALYKKITMEVAE